jgi:hypothetical protein
MIEIPTSVMAQLQTTNWDAYIHAYGSAADIPAYLCALFSDDPEIVEAAIIDLDNRLCHQHVGIAPALEPAYPILITALAALEDKPLGLLLLLELFWGIAKVTGTVDRLRPIRRLNLSWTTIPPPAEPDPSVLYQQIRQALLRSRSHFEAYLIHPDIDMFETALLIVGTMTETPDRTRACFEGILAQEARAWRRAWIYSAFQHLTFANKAAILYERFTEEQDPLVRLALAGQLAHDQGQECPADVVQELITAVIGDCPAELRDQYARVAWGNGFYEDLGISLALSRPALYDAILQRYVRYAEDEERYASFADYVTTLLAFTFCWAARPENNHLTPEQVRVLRYMIYCGQERTMRSSSAWQVSRFGFPTRAADLAQLLKQYPDP